MHGAKVEMVWASLNYGWHFRLRLDHLLYSDDFELIDVKVVDNYLSDHRPLIVTFRLKN